MKKEPNPQHTLSVYFCGQEDCGPNHSFGPAMRPHYLLHVIFHGKGIYQCSGHTYHLKTGDAFSSAPWTPSTTAPTPPTPGATPGQALTAPPAKKS